MKGERRTLKLDTIRVDERAQPRAALSADRIAEYVEDMSRGDKFPPLIVFQDKKRTYWLADGFHRYHAHVGVDAKTVDCVVHKGELRDAVLYSCGANAAHGLRRTNADKRQAVAKLLNDKEWRAWSDREIARQCRVSDTLVLRLRQELMPVTASKSSDDTRTYRTKHGTTARMNTAKVGKARGRQGSLEPDAPDPPLAAPSPSVAPSIARDNENGWISSALWEIERQIDALPPPEQAAARFPAHHRHTFTTAKLRALAEWLAMFAEAWGQVSESNHGEKARAEAAAH